MPILVSWYWRGDQIEAASVVSRVTGRFALLTSDFGLLSSDSPNQSTGPNTPEGRDAVRFNALRHGLTAKHAVLENENEQEFQEMLEAFEAEHQPTGPTENLLVQQMVMAAWRLGRLRAVETGLFNIRMVDLTERTRNAYASLPETERQASAFLEDTRGVGAIEKLSRYETRIERSFYRALHELQRLRQNAPPIPAPDSCLPSFAKQNRHERNELIPEMKMGANSAAVARQREHKSDFGQTKPIFLKLKKPRHIDPP